MITTPPPSLRLRRKSSQHRVESAETLKVGESHETLPTDPGLKRATTCEQALATPCGTPTPAATGSAKDKPKPRKNRLRKMKTVDVEAEQSPVNEKALPLYPTERSPAKRPKAKAKALVKASNVLKRPAAHGRSKVKGNQKTGCGSGVSTPKAKPKAKVKATPKPKPASCKRKQPDEDQGEDQDEIEDEDEDEDENGQQEEQEEEGRVGTEESEITAKAKRAHKLYMRFWRNLRSQGLNTSAFFFATIRVNVFVCIKAGTLRQKSRTCRNASSTAWASL